ncbi:MAG: biopolymer transporter ExbD [Verrucomicrobiae bacterium]
MAGGGVSEDGDVGFQIAPMVDVVFVLLLFFMSCAGQQVLEMELNISLPSGRSAGAASSVPSTPIIIDVMPDGKIQMNNKVYDSPTSKELPELKAWLKETIAKFGDKDPVIIRPDPQTKHERVMDVLNAASAAGVTKLSFS